MPFERIDLRQESVRLEDAVAAAVKSLRDGKIVVFPTETVYGLAVRAGDEEAVNRLVQLKGRDEGHPFAMAFYGMTAVQDFVPEMSELGLRLARRCWPGPVSLVMDASDRGSEFHHLPKSVQNVVSLSTTVCFRVPNHLLTLSTIGELGEPIILTSANRTGRPEASTAEEIITELGSGIDLLIDDGPMVEAKPSTILQIDGDHYKVLREGAVRASTIDRLTARMILFICTGNTCRSPMAERICEKLLAERFGCEIEQLEERGFVVLSAGIAAGYEAPASSNAQTIMQRQGLSLSDHRSQQLNETHIRFADHIFTMTRGHREAILSYWPGADTRLNVLRLDGGDISDPIGGSEAMYEACARQIEAEIDKRLDELLPP